MGLLDGKVVLVTGAANGIGRASAVRFAREGAAAVVVADVDDDGGAETVRLVEAAGSVGSFVHCDVAIEAEVMAMVAHAVSTYGRLDGAYNNAGLGAGQVLAAEIPRSGWDRTLDVNFTGTWLCMKYELQHMVERRSGTIVNQSSASALVGMPLITAYGATKAAIAHMTKSTAVGYAPMGIRVNALAPGPINTDMVARAMRANPDLEAHLMGHLPMKRLGEPDEVAKAAAWLLSDESSYITGVTIPIDGGQTSNG